MVFGLALPGMLWLRFVRGHATHPAEDAVLGLAVGYSVELVAYGVARAVGAPQAFLIWPVATLAAFAIIPGLRGHWRAGSERAPVWWSWSLAAILGFLAIYAAGTFFAQHAIVGSSVPYVDMPFHLALIGELKHHLPPQVPFVAGLPLAYHWFFYVEAAATSWATGIEPATLLYRLAGLPMFVAFVVLTAVTARRITGAWWSGPVAAGLAVFGVAATPYAWVSGSVPTSQTLSTTWISPTHLFGLALFSALLVVIVDMVDPAHHRRRAEWVLTAVLTFAVGGAKAPLLPLLIGGLGIVLAGSTIRRQWPSRPALGALGLALLGLVFVLLVLFRGAPSGASPGLGAVMVFPLANAVGGGAAHRLAFVAIAAAVLTASIFLWSFLWSAAFGLLRQWRASGADPRVLLLVGVCAAGIGAVTFLEYPGQGQYYYVRGAAGAFGVVGAAGLWRLVPVGARRGVWITGAAIAAGIGAIAVVVIRGLGIQRPATIGHDHLPTIIFSILAPVFGLAVLAVMGCLIARRVDRRVVSLKGSAAFLTVAFVMGFSLPPALALARSSLTTGTNTGAVVPAAGIEAARWLRDHSGPDDLIATDVHCIPIPKQPDKCDSRHFWVSAYTERHVLVEGWSYAWTPVAAANQPGSDQRVAPFWDPALLAANDLAFTDPSAASLGALRATGVHWLFADVAATNVDALGRQAHLRELVGDFAVYELP